MPTILPRLLLAAFILFATACSTTTPEDPSVLPQTFSAYIGGFFTGSSYKVELHQGILTYTASDRGSLDSKAQTINPTAAQWRAFRKALDDLKVWQWRRSYPSDISDGTAWSLEIAYPDHSLKSHGNNAYPDTNGRSNASLYATSTSTFHDYTNAVKDLLGGRDFE